MRGRGGAGREESQNVPAEAAPDQACAERPGFLQRSHRHLDGWGRALVEVTQAGVRGVEQGAELLERSAVQGRDGGTHPSVFPEHVPHTAGEHRRQLLGAALPRIPQRLHPEQLARPRTLGAALVVAGARQRPGIAGVDRHQPPAAGEHERHRLDGEIGKVDAQRRVGLAVERGELVEQAGVGAQPLVLHARAQPRQLATVELGAGEAEQGQA